MPKKQRCLQNQKVKWNSTKDLNMKKKMKQAINEEYKKQQEKL
jgi:hypothetical protein